LGNKYLCSFCLDRQKEHRYLLPNLLTNFFCEAMDIAGISSSSTSSSTSNKCTASVDCTEIAVVYCSECEDYFCEKDNEFHKRGKKTQNHRVEELNAERTSKVRYNNFLTP
jgi:hypothetical protein